MADRDWYDDSDRRVAVRRADRATRLGWAAIAGVTALLGIVLIAVVLVCLVAAAAFGYAVAVMD